jgi:phospholipase/lecithinase/hemolysin
MPAQALESIAFPAPKAMPQHTGPQGVAPFDPDLGAKMIFSSKATLERRRAVARTVASCLGALCLGLIAACGGGTSQYEAFIPKRLLVFGDDTSTLTPTGRKYGVNGVDGAGVVDCTQQPIWVQSVASQYGFSFAECNPTFAEPNAFIRAGVGAKVADVAAQVEAQVAAGGFREKDLATVLAGTNDIIELYQQYPGRSVSSLLDESRARGKQLALVVNRLVELGVKVVVSDLPDVGLTPYAATQKALDLTGLDRANLLTQLTTAFNEQLGVSVVLDGRYVGLVQAQLRFQAVSVSPSSFGLSNITDVVCTVELPNCTTDTLVSGATLSGYLWADDQHLAPTGHSQLAALAIDRAARNPF